MINKKELVKIDLAVEKLVELMKPIVTKLNKSKEQSDCYVLSGWGDLQQCANKVNKAFLTIKE